MHSQRKISTVRLAFLTFTVFVLTMLALMTAGDGLSASLPRPSHETVEPELSWQALVEMKQQHIADRIPSKWRLKLEIVESARGVKNLATDFIENLLDPKTLCITSQDADEIADQLSKGRLKAVEVTEAFCKRAVYSHQLIPYLLDFDYDLAISQARELDEYFQKHRRPKGPLHGLPVSFKDQFHVKGLETTMGYVGWIRTFEGRKNDTGYLRFESQIVRHLRALGAIPYAKTSLVQTLRSGETNNNILGYLWNPVNTKLTAGGSSGGEGVVAAFKGSAFGFGTDSGGSVSMPAAYCGVFSLKPSYQRLPWNGIPTNAPGQTLVPTVPGVIANSVSTLRRVAKALMSAEPWRGDANVVKLPWRDDVELAVKNTSLVLGVLRHDGVVKPHPPVLRALDMVESAVQKAGHKIVQWKPPSHKTSASIHKKIISADGMPSIVENIRLSGEPFVPEVAKKFPSGGENPVAPLRDFEKIAVDLDLYRQAYHEYWESTESTTGTGRPVDAVVFPVGPHAANIPGKAYWWTYTSVLNVLDYCAVVIPVTHVDANKDEPDQAYQPVSEVDKLNWNAYNAEVYDGAPIGVMIVGRRLEEEKVLAVADVVMQALVATRKSRKSGCA